MRVCSRCGYASADHLSYCVQCGRRFASSPEGREPAAITARSATPFAVTLALSGEDARVTADAPGHIAGQDPGSVPGRSSEQGGTYDDPRDDRQDPKNRGNALRAAVESMRYVFTHLRGRVDAGARRRRLADEREGAVRLASGALVDLGQSVLTEGINSPELNGLLEAVGAAEAQRENAVGEMAAAEAFRAAEDARLGQIEKVALAEVEACEGGIQETERMLRQIDADRARLQATASPGALDPTARLAFETRRAGVEQQSDQFRERAAALRAAVMAARTKVDHAVAARRQASAALNASIAGHGRQRTEAEGRILELTTQIGRVAWRARLPDARLLPRYERIDRHNQMLEDRDRQIATVHRMVGRYDRRKLATGVGLLMGIVAAGLTTLWVLLR
jgi:hypothetical protein